jgi:uncharacterized protein YcfL
MKKAVSFVLLLLLLVGCKGKLNVEKTVQLKLSIPEIFNIDPIAKEQAIQVSAKAESGMFNVYVYLSKDEAAAEMEIIANKPGAKIIAHKLKATEADLQATIPANEKAAVYVVSGDGKKAEVKLKISN